MSTLKERIRLAAERMGPQFKQSDLANYCKVSTPSVSNWFSGRTKDIKTAPARKAAEFLGCDATWLAEGVGLPKWREDQYPMAVQEPSPESSWDSRAALILRVHDLEQTLDSKPDWPIRDITPQEWAAMRPWEILQIQSAVGMAWAHILQARAKGGEQQTPVAA
jgi:transcriptional regulator with XRE-family HTH domain